MNKHRTLDREAPEVLTTTQLGRTQALTPEGFLLCTDVPIKRTGVMLYAPGETPVKPGKDGVAYVTRDADSLFAAETVASYQGKAVTDNHPPVDVDPTNWKRYSRGIVLNPRRGVGDNADVMLADLLIMDAETIADVKAGKREVSAGYTADYEQTGEGEGRQNHIIGNHVALVARGRCGPRCSIGDHHPSSLKGKTKMATKPRSRVKLTEMIRTAFKDAGDDLASALAGDDTDGAMLNDEPGSDDGGTHIHIHQGGAGAPAAPGGDDVPADPVEARFQALEQGQQEIMGQLAQLAQAINGTNTPAADDKPATGEDDPPAAAADDPPPADDKDPPGATKDSAALATSFQATLADAEILIPGFRMPTFDAALPRAKTIDHMCSLRRSVLQNMASTLAGAQLLDQVSGDGGTVIDPTKASCADVAVAFKAAAVVKRTMNNRTATGDAAKVPALAGPTKSAAMTIAQINKANAEYWKGR